MCACVQGRKGADRGRAWIVVDMTEGSAHDQCARMGGVNTHKGAWISSRRARVPKERLKGSCVDMGGKS